LTLLPDSRLRVANVWRSECSVSGRTPRSARSTFIRAQARLTVVSSTAVPLREANTQPPDRRYRKVWSPRRAISIAGVTITLRKPQRTLTTLLNSLLPDSVELFSRRRNLRDRFQFSVALHLAQLFELDCHLRFDFGHQLLKVRPLPEQLEHRVDPQQPPVPATVLSEVASERSQRIAGVATPTMSMETASPTSSATST